MKGKLLTPKYKWYCTLELNVNTLTRGTFW